MSQVRPCLCYFFILIWFYSMETFYCHILDFKFSSFHSFPTSLFFLQLLHLHQCRFYETCLPSSISYLAILTDYHWHNWGWFGSHTFILISNVDIFFSTLATFSSRQFSLNSMLSFRSLTSYLVLFISFVVTVKENFYLLPAF